MTGELEIIVNGDSHVLQVESSLEDGVLYFELNGVTLVTPTIQVTWTGEQKTVLD